MAKFLQRGAAGAYDAHYRRLAGRLVRAGLGDAILVLGWEMNSINYNGRCGPAPRHWKRYWRRIVRVMRRERGERFRFDFTPSRGRDAVPWNRCYPGDRYVDIIGLDSYDQPPGKKFADYANQRYGLGAQARFARAHGKPISFPEWGLFRRGDNPDYVRRMYRWMRTHNVAYQTITDYCPHGVWRCRSHPRSARVYRELFGGRRNDPQR
ncbi:glycosyl hydrolase [Actinomadura hibisca]|uniref:glycosyl hydrolase n=1 Tax=Actinomadura hibisca TaxID=68565 RepID=UPI00082A0C28|nr:glycosyl hydrolase [Actinomadura hibisca]